MPLTNTDLYLRGSILTNGLYYEMGKGVTGTNYSLGKAKYGSNDYSGGTGVFGSANPAEVRMSYWQSYDHDAMTFRFSPPVTADADTYDDSGASPNSFPTPPNGIPYINHGGVPGGITNTWEYAGASGRAQTWGEFDGVAAGDAYKQGTGGVMVMCGWVLPFDNSSGQTSVVGNNTSLYPRSAYEGYQLDLTTGMNMRCLRGDGGGTGSGNRRTFQSTGVLVQEEWNFVVWQGHYSNTTINTTNNYFYIWNPTNGWQAGATFVSGTGGNVAYTDETWKFASGANSNRWFAGVVGHWYVFNQAQPAANMIDLKDATRVYYGV